MRRGFVLALGMMCLSIPLSESAAAADRAEVQEPTKADKKEAAIAFKAGVSAFKKKHFVKAAEHFEAAHSLAPHAKALWNAADARDKAGEPVRAANLYLEYLDFASEDAKDRDDAEARLSELKSNLGQLDLFGPDATDIRVDDEPAEPGVVFVDAGDHVVEAEVGGERIRKTASVEAGGTLKVRLEPPRSDLPSSKSDDPEPDSSNQDEPPDEESGGMDPMVVYVGAGVTAVLVGATIWSGLDTQSQRENFDNNPTQTGYEEGVSAQKRTNILLGVSLAAAATTAALGLFAVRWDDGKEAAASVTPGGASIHVRF